MSNLLADDHKDQTSPVVHIESTIHSVSNAAPQDEDFTSCRQHSTIATNSSESSSVGSDEKSFTTAYGMVVWPTLPGVSVSSSVAAPPAEPRTGAAGSETGSLACTSQSDQQQQQQQQKQQKHQGQSQSHKEEPQNHHRLPTASAGDRGTSNGNTWSQQRAQKARTREASRANITTNHLLQHGASLQGFQGLQNLLRSACDACHRMKRKCDGKQPCTRCTRRNRDCSYSCRQKSGPPKGSKRKLIEAEDDLPENRAYKPRLPINDWVREDDEVVVSKPTATGTVPAESAQATDGPSPEARAAAAAAVAASRINALAPVSPLAAVGMNPPYLVRGRSILPGVTGGTAVPGHSAYGTIYQSYPPEVYALYLAELRQRGTNISGDIKEEGVIKSAALANPSTVGVGVEGVRIENTLTSPTEVTPASAAAAAVADFASRFTAKSPAGVQDLASASELLSEAVTWVEQLKDADEAEQASHPSNVADGGTSGRSGLDDQEKNTEGVGPASAASALAVAVAAAIEQGDPKESLPPSSGSDPCWSGTNALAETVATPITTEGRPCDETPGEGAGIFPGVTVKPQEEQSASRTTQREATAGMGITLQDTTRSTHSVPGSYNGSCVQDDHHEHVGDEGAFTRNGTNEATMVRGENEGRASLRETRNSMVGLTQHLPGPPRRQ